MWYKGRVFLYLSILLPFFSCIILGFFFFFFCSIPISLCDATIMHHNVVVFMFFGNFKFTFLTDSACFCLLCILTFALVTQNFGFYFVQQNRYVKTFILPWLTQYRQWRLNLLVGSQLNRKVMTLTSAVDVKISLVGDM